MDDDDSDRSEPDDITDDNLEISPLDGESARSRQVLRGVHLLDRRRIRLTSGLLTIALVFAVAGSLVWRAAPDPGGALRALTGLPTPAPSATLGPGANTLLLAHSVPWGTLIIDGKRVVSRQLPGGQIAVSLSHGRHTLVYTAQRFPTLRCMVSAPSEPTDTCPLTESTDDSQPDSTPGLVRIVDLIDTPQRLAPTSYAALIDAIRAALARATTQEPLRAGDRYLAPNGAVTVARGGERFGVRYSLSWRSTGQAPQSAQTPCVTVCAPTFPASAELHDLQWPLQVVGVIPEFTVTDSRGATATIAPNILGATPPWMTLIAVTSLLNGRWQVSMLEDPSYSAVAYVAVDRFTSAAGSASPEIALPSKYTGYSISSGAHPLAGCLITLRDDSGAPGPKALWRYGAVFAADDLAQQDFPTLPRANDSEQAVANSIAEYGG